MQSWPLVSFGYQNEFWDSSKSLRNRLLMVSLTLYGSYINWGEKCWRKCAFIIIYYSLQLPESKILHFFFFLTFETITLIRFCQISDTCLAFSCSFSKILLSQFILNFSITFANMFINTDLVILLNHCPNLCKEMHLLKIFVVSLFSALRMIKWPICSIFNKI